MTVADLPPEWRDHYLEGVAIAVEGGGNEEIAKRERWAATLEAMKRHELRMLEKRPAPRTAVRDGPPRR